MYRRWPFVRGCACAAVAILFTLAAGSARADQLFGITRNNQLITIDPATAVGTLVGNLSTNMIPPGLAFRGTKLYTYDQNAQKLQQLDPATAATLATIDLGINTGVDLDALIEVGRMAETIVGHPLPGELIHAGSLDAFRRKAA